ncbi:penicillin-insensitive murein endopeptidase [uncultured Thiodictyon sp.]|uniref:penicillin-insensitive murein endopeptidase n=1 Tax=uncultured Thiodictyon sp. TaxID=1846217 RepID=UPI0025EB161A|nr:penicillin-insensitive murein endopeptidase [uncultured Thiodictyon sp.]
MTRALPYPARMLFAAIPTLYACLLWSGHTQAATPWAEVMNPSHGPAQVIGTPANGCVGGADALPESGPGYVSVRRARHRFFGHPQLLRLVDQVGQTAARRHLGLVMIGDLSQPRGGQMPSSHHSHQNGLDVDIWFTLAPTAEAARRLMDDRPDPPSMVLPGSLESSGAWGEPQRFLLETVARNPAVDRIFVNPGIKRAVCNEVTGDRSWLRKLRPWWGHDSHFHVRIRCPAGSPRCEPQTPLPAGDGCGPELAWWFKPEATGKTKKKGEPRPAVVVPAACMAVLHER